MNPKSKACSTNAPTSKGRLKKIYMSGELGTLGADRIIEAHDYGVEYLMSKEYRELIA